MCKYLLLTEFEVPTGPSFFSTLIYGPGLGLSFGFLFFFLVQSQIAVWSLQRMRHWWKATRSDSMISRAMKSHTNEHTVRDRPTLKVVKSFRKGSVCKAYERSTIYERTFWVNSSRIMLYMPKELAVNRVHRLFTLIKSIFRSVIVFLDVIVSQVGFQHELITSEQQPQKG